MSSSIKRCMEATVMLLVALVFFCAPTLALADESADDAETNDTADSPWPTRWVEQPIVMPPGLGLFDGNTLGISLTRRQAGEPIFSPLELYYGFDSKLTLALLHERGICWTEPCGSYNDARAMALYRLVMAPWVEIAASGGLDVTSFSDPFGAGLRGGLIAKAHSGRLGVVFAPELYLGVIGRGALGDRLFLPIEAGWQLEPEIALKLETGWRGPASGFSDAVEIPVGLGVDYRWTRRFEVGAEFRFENFFGRGATFDRRTLFLRVSFWAQFPPARER